MSINKELIVAIYKKLNMGFAKGSNPVSAVFFHNPYFLIIVTLLGITCSIAYIYSKSLWVPVIIHWLTVLIWVLLLGGRNLILDA